MKTKIVFYITLALYLLCPVKVSAEVPDNIGYIITLGNDTVKGYIINANINQFTQCEFRKDMHEPIIKYKPGEIKAYRFLNNGKFFISQQILKNNQMQTYFLEYLIKGRANIYFMRDNTDHYFMQKDGDILFELSEPPVLTKDDEGVMYYKPQKFTGKIKYILSDCPEIYAKIDNTKLNPTDLINLAKDYHNRVCDSARCIIFERKISAIKIRKGFFVGISNNELYFNTKNYTDRRNNFLTGVKLEFENLFFSYERVFVETGLIYQHFSTYNFTTDLYRYNGVVYSSDSRRDIDINASVLKIPLAVNYLFGLGKIRPYIGCGVTNTFYLSQSKELYITDFTDYFGNTIPVYHLGIAGSIGIRYHLNKGNCLFLEGRYEGQQNMNQNYMLRMKNHYFACHLGYMF